MPFVDLVSGDVMNTDHIAHITCGKDGSGNIYFRDGTKRLRRDIESVIKEVISQSGHVVPAAPGFELLSIVWESDFASQYMR